MRVTVNDGPSFDLGNAPLKIVVDVSGEETLPPTTITVNGGTLNVYPHHVTKDGNVSIHMFGNVENPGSRKIMLNGIIKDIGKDELTYESVCEWAGHPGRTLSVMWHVIGEQQGGILSWGESIPYVSGLAFNAVDTGSA